MRFKSFILFAFLGILGSMTNCTAPLHVEDMKVYCNSTKDCLTGWKCINNVCVNPSADRDVIQDTSHEVTCTPDCWYKECGNDGCGGSCGTCDSGQYCNSSHKCASSCMPKTCSDLGWECGTGDNGCGGTVDCGTCDSGKTCDSSHKCQKRPLACGDGTCVASAGENCSTCFTDCPCLPGSGCQNGKCGPMSRCGDGTCNGDENCGNCSKDCGCLNGRLCYKNACCKPRTCADLGLECGTWDNGCGGTVDCGECGVNQKCEAGFCVATHPVKCDASNLPTTWGGATIIYAIQLVDSSKPDAMKVCADFNGDGRPDNGFGSFASMANGYQKDDGSFTNTNGLLLEFVGVTNYTNTNSFQMNGLFGELKAIIDGNKDAVASKTDSNKVYADPASYGSLNGVCGPRWHFDKAKITGGFLDSGEATSWVLPLFNIPVSGNISDIPIQHARFTGKVSSGGPDGVVLTDMVFTGYILKTDIDAALAAAQDYCDNAENPPSACNYLTLIPSVLTYDLDMNNDDEPDAISLCVTFHSVKAKIAGYIPAAN